MRVSVLIPTYNRAEYLGAAIESVRAQTYRDFEIVVVDDGSTDETPELLRRYSSVRYVYQDHAGIPQARNRALAEAKGELIAWLDSDDLYAPTKLEKQVAYLDAHTECQIVFCWFRSFSDIDPSAWTSRQRAMLKNGQIMYQFYPSSSCIRRMLYDKVGNYNEKYTYGEDTEWLFRMHLCGVDTCHCLQEILYLRRVHNGQITFMHEPVNRQETGTMIADAIRSARQIKKQCRPLEKASSSERTDGCDFTSLWR